MVTMEEIDVEDSSTSQHNLLAGGRNRRYDVGGSVASMASIACCVVLLLLIMLWFIHSMYASHDGTHPLNSLAALMGYDYGILLWSFSGHFQGQPIEERHSLRE